MATTLLHSESRRLYSWWWSSHISPKNSKWLQENLTDMDAKVKAMIKLIEEDADSFARRAEMYYKRRPELMKLVEEFYRAYRALAERYNHATVELRQAHRTMAEAFPDQVPYALSDDSASSSSIADSDHHTSEMPHTGRKSFEGDDIHSEGNSSTNLHAIRRHGAYSGPNSGISKRGLKQVHEIFYSDEVTSRSSTAAEERTGESFYVPDAEDTTQSFQQGFPHLASENQKLRKQILSETERASKAENEVQSLRKTLSAVQAEKETIFSEYQQNMEKLSHLKKELDCALEEAKEVNEQASKADIEIKILKEAHNKLESERDATLLKYNQTLEKISGLETKLSLAENEVKGLNERAVNAESELQKLKHELSRLEAEKEAGLLQYRQCLQTISILENKISQAELDARKLSQEADSSEAEIRRLKKAIATSNEEKEATASLYKQCLERVARLESELSRAREEVEQLSGEMLLRTTKLKNAEEKCSLLEKSNLTLQSEAENLVEKISLKDRELSTKSEELEKLQKSMQHENLRFLQVQDSLQTLQKLHCDSQEEQRALATEIRVGFQMLKELEMCKHGLEEEIKLVKEENQNLNGINLSSTVSQEKMKDELCSLTRMKENLEEDLDAQATLSDALQQEICQLREEIKGLNGCYQALLSQVELTGLDPKNLESSVRAMQDENSKLRESSEKDREHKELIYEKLKSMDKLMEQNTVLERSLSDLNGELNVSKEKIKLLQESYQFLQGEKSSVVTDKAALLSQLQVITENMQKILEKNTSLENSLFTAKVEVESLREKANRLDDLCQLLMKEKSNLLDERSTLVLQLDSVEMRLSNLERRFTNLEEKCSKLEMEKETTLCQVEELRGYLSLEKQEHATYIQSSETRLAALENQVHILQEEILLRKKDFEAELEKAVNAQVEIFILQKFVEDLEAKNLALFIECQKQAEASKLSNKLISELEIENLEQQVEVEMLSDEVDQLRTEIYQVFRALQILPGVGYKDENEKENVSSHVEQVSLLHILDNIEHLKMSLLRNKDDKQKLLIENSVLLTVLGQLRSESAQIESRKNLIEKEIKVMAEQCQMLEEDKCKLLELNELLRLEVDEGSHHKEVLQGDLRNMDEKLGNIHEAYLSLQAEYSKACKENEDLLEKVRVLEHHKHTLEEENSVMLEKTVALDNMSLVLKSFGMEKAEELTRHVHELQSLQVLNKDLKEEITKSEEKLEKKRLENLHLVDSIERLNMELHEVRDFNDELNHQILIGNDFLREKARELSEVEQKFELSQRSTLKLCGTLEELKREQEKSQLCTTRVEKQIEELSVVRANQEKEIESLLEVNNSLEYEVHVLRQEIEEHRIREENLSSELQERSQEFELWEAEASAFYFDLQISAVHEVLLQNKVHELTELCESFKDASSIKSGEIEQMKDRVDFLEYEIRSFKDQLSTFVPILSSLRDNMPTIEQTTIQWRTCHVEGSPDVKGIQVEDKVHENYHKKAREVQNAAPPEEMSDLQKMQCRIEAVERAVLEEHEKLRGQKKLMAVVGGLRNLDQESTLPICEDIPKEEALSEKSNKTSAKALDIRAALLTKDIPLDQDSFNGRNSKRSAADDQMLELEESSKVSCPNPAADEIESITSGSEPDVACHQFEHVSQKSRDSSMELQVEKELGIDRLEITSSRELGKEMNRRKLLERLTSDAQKLSVLKAKVQDMKSTAEIKKKNKKADNKYETVKKQLQEVEETVEQLMVVNDHLARDVDKNTSSLHENVLLESKDIGSVHRKKVREQAKIESEKIGRLQFEVQSIHYALLKIQDEKKTKGRSKFSSRTGIILRDFIYNGGRSSEKRRKKGCLCGCARPRTDGD